MMITGIAFLCTHHAGCTRLGPQWTTNFTITTRTDETGDTWAVAAARCEFCSEVHEVLFIGNLKTGAE